MSRTKNHTPLTDHSSFEEGTNWIPDPSPSSHFKPQSGKGKSFWHGKSEDQVPIIIVCMYWSSVWPETANESSGAHLTDLWQFLEFLVGPFEYCLPSAGNKRKRCADQVADGLWWFYNSLQEHFVWCTAATILHQDALCDDDGTAVEEHQEPLQHVHLHGSSQAVQPLLL